MISPIAEAGCDDRSDCAHAPNTLNCPTRIFTLALRTENIFLPNVKDEPRPWPARRVRHDDLDSEVSLRDS